MEQSRAGTKLQSFKLILYIWSFISVSLWNIFLVVTKNEVYYSKCFASFARHYIPDSSYHDFEEVKTLTFAWDSHFSESH